MTQTNEKAIPQKVWAACFSKIDGLTLNAAECNIVTGKKPEEKQSYVGCGFNQHKEPIEIVLFNPGKVEAHSKQGLIVFSHVDKTKVEAWILGVISCQWLVRQVNSVAFGLPS